MKKTTTLFLVLCLMLAAVLSCGKTAEQPAKSGETPLPSNAVTEYNLPTDKTGELNTDATLPPAPISESQAITGKSGIGSADFVLIYDPFRFDETSDEKSRLAQLFSGEIGSQIVIGLNRADEKDERFPTPQGMMSQKELLGLVKTDMDQIDREGGRAGGMDPVYHKGDTHSFYTFDSFLSIRQKKEFTCVYEGTNCYIWSFDNAIDESTAASVGNEFDRKIYSNDVQYFGTPRFTENGGKINILFRPFSSKGLGGFFCRYDIFSSLEVPQYYAEMNGLNTDHAIITINSNFLKTDMSFVYSTLAHELQHLICASEAFYYADSPFMQTWLDEAMSAYAEELSYPGIKAQGGYNYCMYLSDNCRRGQSIYNFNADQDEYIGSYGVAYLFAKYLTQHAGSDVFKTIHTYWRNSYSATVTEAEALYHSMPQSFITEIDDKYAYPISISSRFTSKEEEWLSKMTLDFYIETVSMDLAELNEYVDTLHLYMLYSEVNPLDIEGGGRIFVATENGTFTFPDDSGRGLVFIGFDRNFHLQSEIYTNAK